MSIQLAPPDFMDALRKTWGEVPKTTVGPRACAECGAKDKTVLVTMLPGHDGVVWFLCLKCHCEGHRTKEREAELAAKLERREGQG